MIDESLVTITTVVIMFVLCWRWLLLVAIVIVSHCVPITTNNNIHNKLHTHSPAGTVLGSHSLDALHTQHWTWIAATKTCRPGNPKQSKMVRNNSKLVTTELLNSINATLENSNISRYGLYIFLLWLHWIYILSFDCLANQSIATSQHAASDSRNKLLSCCRRYRSTPAAMRNCAILATMWARRSIRSSRERCSV